MCVRTYWRTPRRVQVIAAKKNRLATSDVPRAPVPVDVFSRERVDLLHEIGLDELPVCFEVARANEKKNVLKVAHARTKKKNVLK